MQNQNKYNINDLSSCGFSIVLNKCQYTCLLIQNVSSNLICVQYVSYTYNTNTQVKKHYFQYTHVDLLSHTLNCRTLNKCPHVTTLAALPQTKQPSPPYTPRLPSELTITQYRTLLSPNALSHYCCSLLVIYVCWHVIHITAFQQFRHNNAAQ